MREYKVIGHLRDALGVDTLELSEAGLCRVDGIDPLCVAYECGIVCMVNDADANTIARRSNYEI